MGLWRWGEYVAALEGLRRAYAGRVALRVLAESPAGRPVTHLSIGTGANHVLLLDGVHPNEPVSLLASVLEAGRLCRHPTLLERYDLTLDVLCADPDGLAANDRWIRHRRPDPLGCALRHVRDDDPGEQVEWSFPAQIGDHRWCWPVPGTRAVMRYAAQLPDGHRLVTLRSGHNISLWTGVYFWLSGDPAAAGSVAALGAAARRCGIPVESGAPESASCRPRGPGVYEYCTLQEKWSWFSGRGVSGGRSAFEFLTAAHPDLVGVNCDVPLFVPSRLDPAVAGLSPGELAAAARSVLGALPELTRRAADTAADLPMADPLVRAARTADGRRVLWGAEQRPPDAVHDLVIGPYHRAQRAGMLRATLDRYGRDRGLADQLAGEVRRVVGTAVRLGGITPVPLRNAVALQVLSGRIALRAALRRASDPRNPGATEPGGPPNPGFTEPGDPPNPGFTEPGGPRRTGRPHAGRAAAASLGG